MRGGVCLLVLGLLVSTPASAVEPNAELFKLLAAPLDKDPQIHLVQLELFSMIARFCSDQASAFFERDSADIDHALTDFIAKVSASGAEIDWAKDVANDYMMKATVDSLSPYGDIADFCKSSWHYIIPTMFPAQP